MIGYGESRIRKVGGGGGCPEDGVQIGDQCWMAKNLDIDDGLGGIFYPNGDVENVEDYGLLYTWHAAVRVSSNVEGFQLPSRDAFDSLAIFVGGADVAGFMLKSSGSDFWNEPNLHNSDPYGFGARGSGWRNNVGAYRNFRQRSFFWTSFQVTETSSRRVYMQQDTMWLSSGSASNEIAYSVRLIKNS